MSYHHNPSKTTRWIRPKFLTLVLLLAIAANAQEMPVKFSVQQKQVSPTEVDVVFTAKIDKGWHVYSTNIPDGGPTAATMHTEKAEGAQPMGGLIKQGKEISEDDQIFGMRLSYFENAVTFIQKYKITAKTYNIKGYLEYGACNDEMCMPPSTVEFEYSGKGPEEAPAAEPIKEEAATPAAATDAALTAALATGITADTTAADTVNGTLPIVVDSALVASSQDKWWQPSVDELKALNGGNISDRSWLYIFLMGLLYGLLAVFTPCVWPIIPMTVSFFLKRSKDKKKGIKDAITYGISIVVIYLALGLLVTALFGAQTLNDLATNAVFNLIFCALLVVFALSFFGWFELTLPSSWTNKVDNKASETSGLLSIFLMAFTLTLVSFSCTGPIIGLLLVETTTSGNWMGPAIGMLGFAIALALPFTLFALFPTWLKQAPKSGSWMNIIKVVLGFIELAFALKFFSVADLAYGWRLLDREVFLALWIAIFLFLGLYLIGKLKFQSDQGNDKAMPVPCIMLGLVSIAFAIYMVPGLWGAPCRAVSAFAPPLYTQDFNLNTKEVRAAYTNYEEGMAAAKASGKPVMLDFTGFGCVNCRKMEIAVWTDPTVADKLNKDYVLISLFVDDKTPLDEPIEVEYNGKKRTLRTIGDKWSYLEEMKFGHLTQPLYVLVDNDGNPMTRSFSYKEDVSEYLKFLGEGLEKYK
ncbi:MAG: thioredoxin family protein [Prevotella sp.]|nr:thioredoxin family protein [Prevotella sp.]